MVWLKMEANCSVLEVTFVGYTVTWHMLIG